MKIVCIFSLFFLFSVSVQAQNTKGDKPVSNQRQVRESKGKAKAQKGNKRAKTKDIAGRRLRVKDKSSANRANVGLPQPNPYQGRKKSQSDRAAKPRGRIFTEAPREQQQRAWHGDISGKPIRRIKPSKSGVARSNVYPQRNAYAKARKHPLKEKPKVYTKTASGEYPIRRTPQNTQRAWKGNLKGGPVGTPSRTGQIKNTYKQFGAFGNHPSRKPKTSDKIKNGGFQPALLRSASPWPRNKRYGQPASASRSFLSRGKKNVYWGKYKKDGKPVTTDLTGAPLRTRNYRSMPAGLIGRDTLKGFGRRPGGDRASKQKGGLFSTIKGQRAWTGDISGKPLRRTKPRTQESTGKFFYPRKMSVSTSGRVGHPLPSAGLKSKIRKERAELNGLPVRPPGVGGNAVGKYQRNINGRRTIKGGGSVSGKRWNNNGLPIDVNTAGAGTIRASKFQGAFKRGELGPGFSPQGADFAGNIKTRRPPKGGGSVSGRVWNNNGSPVDVNRAGAGTIRASKFQGTFRKGELGPGFTKQGADFAGNIKTRRPEKGGGSVSGKVWNNNGEPVDVNRAGAGTIRASKYQGSFRKGELGPGFTKQGVDFAGNIKTRRPAKGGGSISGKLWNNDEQPIDVNEAGSGTIKASKFQGKTKDGNLFKKGYVQNPNAFDESLKKSRPNETTFKIGEFLGGQKQGSLFKKGYVQNPNAFDESVKKARPNETTFKIGEFLGGQKQGSLFKKGYVQNPNAFSESTKKLRPGETTFKIGEVVNGQKQGSLFKKGYVQNPNSNKESIKKLRPDETTYKVAGLQVKVRERSYDDKPNAKPGSMPGIAPLKSSVKASEYARSMKVTWDYKHNPNSSEAALKVHYPGKAMARLGDYQGNMKMHKYNDKRLHPDAQFAHSVHDNVKGERTLLMNVKLFWSKLFKKNDTQPENLKEKNRKPRYDRGELGMWYN